MKTPAVMLLLSVCALAACPPGNGDPDAGQSLEPKLSVIIADVFQPRCGATACHGGPGPAAFLNLEQNVHASLVDVDSDTDPTIKRVVAGDPEASLLYLVLLGATNGVSQMPEGGTLEAFEIEAIRTWIEDGALDN